MQYLTPQVDSNSGASKAAAGTSRRGVAPAREEVFEVRVRFGFDRVRHGCGADLGVRESELIAHPDHVPTAAGQDVVRQRLERDVGLVVGLGQRQVRCSRPPPRGEELAHVMLVEQNRGPRAGVLIGVAHLALREQSIAKAAAGARSDAWYHSKVDQRVLIFEFNR